MKIIVGLGNPGKKYEGTRHNAGFMFVDKMTKEPEFTSVDENLNFKLEKKFESEIAETLHRGQKIILVKPQTYMNLSGRAVQSILSFYKADISDLIVVSDDIDLPVGLARIRQDGGSGGQKGLQSIVDIFGADFTRIRIGIQKSEGRIGNTDDQGTQFDTTEFVLSKFEKRELAILDEIIADTIRYIMPHIGSKTPIPAHSLEVKFDTL